MPNRPSSRIRKVIDVIRLLNLAAAPAKNYKKKKKLVHEHKWGSYIVRCHTLWAGWSQMLDTCARLHMSLAAVAVAPTLEVEAKSKRRPSDLLLQSTVGSVALCCLLRQRWDFFDMSFLLRAQRVKEALSHSSGTSRFVNKWKQVFLQGPHCEMRSRLPCFYPHSFSMYQDWWACDRESEGKGK